MYNISNKNKISIQYSLMYKIDGDYIYFNDCDGLVADELSYIRNCSIKKVQRQYQHFSRKNFIYKYKSAATLKDFVYTLLKKTNFTEGGIRNYYTRIPIAIKTNNNIVHCDNLDIRFEDILKLLDIDNNMEVLLTLSCSAGEIFYEDGIKYFMNSKESGNHHEPHIHIDYRHEHEASLSLRNGTILAGNLPSKVYKKAKNKILTNQRVLFEYWNLYTDGLRVDINYCFKNSN